MAYNPFPYLVAGLVGWPCVTELNALIKDEIEMIGGSKWQIRAIELFQRFSLHRSNRIAAVTRGIRDEIVQVYGIPVSKTAVIPNGTDPDLFRPLDARECRKYTGLEGYTSIVGFVGSCYPYHDVNCLIDAAPLIWSRIPDVKFVIVGDGYMRQIWMQRTAERNVADRFLFTGAIPYEEIPYYMNAFTVCVAPFTIERNTKIGLSPMKLYDYMACGKPVVGSDIEGVGNLLKEAQAGVVVPPEDPYALAEAVVQLLRCGDLRDRMGRNGRMVVEREYTWARTAERVARVCAEAIEEKRAWG